MEGPPDALERSDAYRVLKRYFGYTSFLPHQEGILRAVLEGRDVLAVVATGGGKSLCYQLPALLKDGLTVVVSPLIALMKDQVDALRECGVAAAYLNSTLSYDERVRIEEKLRRGTLSLLYISPERVVQPGFRRILQGLTISLVAIDEAHCISQWGHEFRPEYRQLALIKRTFPATPVIALTATATAAVRQDICEQLHLDRPAEFVGSFLRRNLHYRVIPKSNAYAQLVGYLSGHRGDSGIVYCTSKKTVEDLAQKLNRDGFLALPYHAGLDSRVRSRTQDTFIRDAVRIIVATVAFGMGIDKPDVRFVIHYDLPQTLEQYYQETGRAGRDGEKSDCILLYSRGDRAKVQYFIEKKSSEAEKRVARRKLEQLIEFCESSTCRVRMLLRYFGEELSPPSCGTCDNCLEPRRTFDGTEIAQTVIACVSQIGAPFGAGYIADVLRGAKSGKVKARGHTAVPAYGSGRGTTREQWTEYIGELVRKGYLAVEGDRYPVIVLNERSREIAGGRLNVVLSERRGAPAVRRASAGEGYDAALFALLKDLRTDLSREEGIAPFMIFSDTTLREMAAVMPRTREDLLAIRGIGAHKLRKYGDAFLAAIREQRETRAETSAPPQGGTALSPDSIAETLALYRRGYTVREIAAAREMAEETVGAQIEAIILGGEEISLDDLVIHAKKEAIRDAIARCGHENLRLLKSHLGDRYSYNEIRFVRAWDAVRTE
ncbi:MAG: DNA helicase RecQ [Methanomicrobiaceae archaeon]|nr:DNA helicase RecQ [Methanomicrobiaceae archaeon]